MYGILSSVKLKVENAPINIKTAKKRTTSLLDIVMETDASP
jgi:hypothetical protein